MYSPYEFKSQDARDFAKYVGIKCFERNGELHFQQCPYCKQLTSDKKTFAINLKTGQFKCLRDSCGVRGNMITLAKDFDFSLGNTADEYYRPKKEFKSFKKPKEPIIPKAPAIEYLKRREITEEIAKKYQITTQTDNDKVLVIPFFDEKGNLPFIKYRDTEFKKGDDGNKEWCQAGGKPILFGMMQCNLNNRTLVLNEGQIDSLSCIQAGIENAVSVPTGAKGFTWIPYCWDWITNNFDIIIVFGDYEKGHISLLDEIKQRFKMLRIKHVREEDYKDCKDANEILCKYGESYLRSCIDNAVEEPLTQVKDLADVKDVNIFDIDKLETGIAALDDMLYGGLPFGGVTIITGKAGKGKSSFASQILANALEQNYKCFAYSGELPNHLFKAWLYYQLAGKTHIQTYMTRNNREGYKLSDTNKKLISEWHKGKIFIYDSESVEDENKGLLNVVEETILRYGVRVILIDNLMTGLDLEYSKESDKYERQSKFVKALVRIAMNYNVLILLVAHKRKNASFESETNDEVSGSSDIINLGSVALSYDTGSSKELKEGVLNASQRKLRLTKNRIFGVTNTDGWVLDFEPKSKRIYGSGDDPDKEFGWLKSIDGFDDATTEDLDNLPWR